MYEERLYRGISKPQGLLCYEVRVKETDLYCCTVTDLTARINERVLFYRNQLETYISLRPEFFTSLAPIPADRLAPPIVREMIDVSARLGVGPMACVAGAVAEYVGRDIMELSEEFIIENGGDIYLKTLKERVSIVYAGNSALSGKIGIRLKPGEEPYGICTSSGTVGPSLSLGKADAVSIVARSALFADGLATFIGNGVKKKDHIEAAIERGASFPDVTGILIILGENLGVWGDIELVKT